MKRQILGAILLAMTFVVPVPALAGVDVSIGIGINLPPPIVFGSPPSVVVMPDTDYVYVVPDIDVDLFFWDGWWWRPWEGRWYRSHYYNRGWAYYNYVPGFYFDVDPGWRGYYRSHNWYGHQWHYERIPQQRLQQNWRTWKNDRYWERQRTWGVQNYRPRPQQQLRELRQERQKQYQQRPEVQRHQQQMQQRQVRPAERGRAIAPQADHTGRGENRVQPTEQGRSHGGSEQRGEQRQVKPAKRGKHSGQEEGRGPRDGRRRSDD